MKVHIIFSLCFLSINTSDVLANKNSELKEIALPEPRIVVLGSAGVGKSTLANALLGCAPSKECTFKVCDGIEACTKETTYGIGNWTGSGPIFTIVDTPGFGYSGNDDSELIDDMTTFLQNEVNSTNIFLISFNSEQDKLDTTLEQMIREFSALFGSKFWANVVLEFTHWPFDEHSCTMRNVSGRTEAWKIETVNQGLKEMFDIATDINLPGVFIDSFSQHEINIDDINQQAAFQRETSKLFKFMSEYEPFQFLTIENVLEELFELRKENDRLNRFIEEDLFEIKKDIESVKIDLIHKGDLISRNEDLITRNKFSINDVANETQISTQMLMDELQSQQNEIEMNILPIGSIAAWGGKLITNSNLPKGWQLCDGRVITEGPMKNLLTPNLNTEGRFLRGGSESLDWSYQDQMMPLHQHDVSDPGHKHEDEGHKHSYSSIRHHESGGYMFDNGRASWYEDIDSYESFANILSSQTGISIGDPISTIVPIGNEVRPKNMVVQWIIKIY